MKKPTLAEIEEHITDQITRIMLEKGTGRLTEKQFARECMDLAKWAADRVKHLSVAEQMQFVRSRAMEAMKELGGRE